MKRVDSYTLMMTAVADYCNNPVRIAITNSIPAFRKSVDTMALKNKGIKDLLAKQQENITGFSKTKSAIRQSLCDMSAAILAPAYAFAINKNDLVLAEKLNIPKYLIKKLPAEELPGKMESMLTLIKPFLLELKDYNITQNTLDTWALNIKNMKDTNAGPNVAIGIKKDETDAVEALLQDAIVYCNKSLNKIAEGFMNEQPTYYKQFKNMRRLKTYGTTTTLLRINIVMGDSSEPIFGATVSVKGTDIMGTADLSGKCNLHVPFGIQVIEVSAPGYVSYTGKPTEFKKGKRVTIKNLGLVPDTFNITPSNGQVSEQARVNEKVSNN